MQNEFFECRNGLNDATVSTSWGKHSDAYTVCQLSPQNYVGPLNMTQKTVAYCFMIFNSVSDTTLL